MSGTNFGIEYEIEGSPNVRNAPMWQQIPDGTLRDGGIEYVLNQPLDAGRALKAVKLLLGKLGKTAHSISHRCSSHIHVDVRQMRAQQRVAMTILLVGLEPYFFEGHEDRMKSNFCVPLLRNPSFQSALQMLIRPVSGDLKYMSVNVMPTRSHGSIELRHFSPLMDYDRVEEIITTLEKLYAIAYTITQRATGRTMRRNLLAAVKEDEQLAPYEDNIKWCCDMYIQLLQSRGSR